MYIDKDLIGDRLNEQVDQFNEKNINRRDFYFVLIDHIHPFL